MKKLKLVPIDLAKLRKIYEMHEKFGHASGRALVQLMKTQGYDETPHEVHEATGCCEICNKVKILEIPRKKTQPTKPPRKNHTKSLDFVSMDKSTTVIMIDRMTCYMEDKLVFKKSDVLNYLKDICEEARNLF